MSYTDWLGGLTLIPDRKDKVILELGLGEGTIHLINNFKQVYSFECYKDDVWYNVCNNNYGWNQNWVRTFVNFTDIGMDIADNDLLNSGGGIRNPDVFNAFIGKLMDWIDLTTIDVAFVDQGFHMRGESVNFFLNLGVPIVMAHDFKVFDNNLYGWNLITEHINYSSEIYNSSLGLKVWTKN